MSTKSDNLIPEQRSQAERVDGMLNPDPQTGKKEFVEPEVSFPIDVLEATTFFQVTDSGTTN